MGWGRVSPGNPCPDRGMKVPTAKQPCGPAGRGRIAAACSPAQTGQGLPGDIKLMAARAGFAAPGAILTAPVLAKRPIPAVALAKRAVPAVALGVGGQAVNR